MEENLKKIKNLFIKTVSTLENHKENIQKEIENAKVRFFIINLNVYFFRSWQKTQLCLMEIKILIISKNNKTF